MPGPLVVESLVSRMASYCPIVTSSGIICRMLAVVITALYKLVTTVSSATLHRSLCGAYAQACKGESRHTDMIVAQKLYSTPGVARLWSTVLQSIPVRIVAASAS